MLPGSTVSIVIRLCASSSAAERIKPSWAVLLAAWCDAPCVARDRTGDRRRNDDPACRALPDFRRNGGERNGHAGGAGYSVAVRILRWTSPDDWSGEDIASWGENLHSRFLDWWSAEKDPAVNYTVETYYGI